MSSSLGHNPKCASFSKLKNRHGLVSTKKKYLKKAKRMSMNTETVRKAIEKRMRKMR